MTPAEAPAEFVDMAVEVFEGQAHEHCSEEDGCPGQTRPYHEALVREALAEVLPEHEKQVRQQVARDLNGYAGVPDRDWKPATWSVIRECARIARGGAS